MQVNDIATSLKEPHALPFVPFTSSGRLPNVAAVYFVLRGDAVLYVGQSCSLVVRWIGHHLKSELLALGADLRIAWLELDESELRQVETRYIHALNPPLNKLKPKENRLRLVAGFVRPEVKSLVRKIADDEGRSESRVVRRLLEESPRVKALLRRNNSIGARQENKLRGSGLVTFN